jgi:hypothetical protein
MHFDKTTPCAECPFRRDVAGHLRRDRAAEIAIAVTGGGTTFTCHKTLSDDHDLALPAEQHCAGALIFAAKHEHDLAYRNRMLHIAERLGLYDPRRLRQASFVLVFDPIAEMIAHHSGNAVPRQPRGAPDITRRACAYPDTPAEGASFTTLR